MLNNCLIQKDIDIRLGTDRLINNSRHFGRNNRLLLRNGRTSGGAAAQWAHCWIGVKIEGILSNLYIGIGRRILIEDIRRIARSKTSGGLIGEMRRTS